MKKLIVLMVLMVVLGSLAAVGQEEKEVTPDNIGDVPADQVSEIPANKLTQDVVGKMSPRQIQSLSDNQLSDKNVINALDNSGKIDSLTANQLTSNVYTAMSKTQINKLDQTVLVDSIKNVPASKIPDLEISKLNTAPMGERIVQQMKPDQIANLGANQLDKNVLIYLSTAKEGSKIGDLGIKPFQDAFNKLNGIKITQTESLKGIKITTGNDGKTAIYGANGRGTSVEENPDAKIRIDKEGNIIIDETGKDDEGKDKSVSMYDNNGQKDVDFSGSGQANADGSITCAEKAGCSAKSFEGKDIVVKTVKISSSGERQTHEVHLGGDNAEVKFNADGNIERIRGIVMEGYTQDEDKRWLVGVGDKDGTHYALNLPKGSYIDFEKGKVIEASTKGADFPTDGNLRIIYADSVNIKPLSITEISKGNSFSMSGSDSAQLLNCNGRCIYDNYDKSKVGGLDLPLNGKLVIDAGNGGGFKFIGGDKTAEAQLYGKDSFAGVMAQNEAMLSRTMNMEDGNTRVIIGTSLDNTKLDKNNLDTFAYTDKDGSPEKANLVVINSPRDINGYMVTNNDVLIGISKDFITMEQKGVAAGMSSPLDGHPDVDVGLWDKVICPDATTDVAKINVDGDELVVRTKELSGSNLVIDYPRQENIDGKYVISSTNLGGETGEVFYSNGKDSPPVLLSVKYDSDGKITEYQLKTPSGLFRNSLQGLTKEDVVKTLHDMGLSGAEISNLKGKDGEDYFSEAEQKNIKEYGTIIEPESKGEITKEEMKYLTRPEEPKEGDVYVNEKGEAFFYCGGKWIVAPCEQEIKLSQEEKDAIKNADPSTVKPGLIGGQTYEDDEDVKALISQLGYKNVKEFQEKNNLQADGAVGQQTSAAILNECYGNPSKCNAEALNRFEREVGVFVSTAVDYAKSNSDVATITKNDIGGDGSTKTSAEKTPAPGAGTSQTPTPSPGDKAVGNLIDGVEYNIMVDGRGIAYYYGPSGEIYQVIIDINKMPVCSIDQPTEQVCFIPEEEPLI